MNFGALPVTLKAATSETVSATLGHSALVAGLGAGIAGLILVLLYVLLYYRALGPGGDLRAGADGHVAVGDHLGARAHVGGAELRPGRHHRPDRLHRHHRRLVHRLLRTAEGRDQIGPLRPHLGRPRLQERVADGVGGRLRVAARGHRPLFRRRREREGLRLLPRALDHHGHGGHLVLHTAARHPPRPEPPLAGLGGVQHRHRAGCGTADAGPVPGRAPAREVARERHRRPRRRRDERDGSSLDDVREEDVERLEEGVDTEDLDEEELVSLDDAARALLAKPRRGHGPIARLYRGETRFDFVGKRKIWFSVSTIIIVLGIISIVLRGGLNLGIEFKGGTEWTIAAPGVTQTAGRRCPEGHRPDRSDRPAARYAGASRRSTCSRTSTGSRRPSRRR